MSESELKDTQPTPATTDTQPNSVVPAGKKNFPRWLVALVLIVLVAIGILGGYGSGIGRRYSAQNTQVTGQLMDQLRLGMQAMDAGEYSIAKQHLEFVIQHDPNFPGVQSVYADLLLRMQTTPTLTLTPSPTVTPTPDLRGADEKYNQVKQLLSSSDQDLCSRDWDGIISTLDSLRKTDPTYHTAEVDGMYYISLRSRGMCKIYPQAYQPKTPCADLNINLEGGIYDLTVAKLFGPLDAQADSMRTYARLYIIGASFWDQDWVQAQNYFSQVMAAYPNLSDSSCDTATERWRAVTIKYAEQLLASGDTCGSQDQYIAALAIGSSKNEPYFLTATAIEELCGGGGKGGNKHPTKTPAETPMPTSTPTGG